VDVAVGGDDGAPPQFCGVQVPDGLRVVVVAVETQRAAEVAIVVGVPGEADEFRTVRADGEVAAGVAWFRAAVAVEPPRAGVPLDPAGVNLSERGCGERREHRRMRRHVLANAFAADESGPHDLVGVTLVAFGAGRAHRLPAVAARLVDDPVRQVRRVTLGQHPAGDRVDGGKAAAGRIGRVHAEAVLTCASQAW
jgi:hypothetical protein